MTVTDDLNMSRALNAPDVAERSVGAESPGLVTAVRGRLLWFRDDPFLVGPLEAVRYEQDGLLICENGKITYSGPYSSGEKKLRGGTQVVHYEHHIITPGFVDAHVHYTQIGMIASYGEQLIEWLKKYAYPEELKYANKAHADRGARLFCQELLRNGTTTALVFCSTAPESVDALFEESTRIGMRMAAGKVLMDRGEAKELLDKSVAAAIKQSKDLIDRWHCKEGTRNVYAIIPRFALACSEEMLTAAGELWKSREGLLMHTHVSENVKEIYETRQQFPTCKSYLDVYHQHGLLGPGAVLAHGVHLSSEELDTCYQTSSAIAHCPTSNLFLGSGLFRLRDAKSPRRPITVGLGTDVGAGTSLSLLTTMNEAYKVASLDGHPVDAIRLFYLATRGGAKALRMDHQIGSLDEGYEADFVALDLEATPVLANRTPISNGSIGDLLFALAILGDDRAVEATYIAGRLAYQRGQKDRRERRDETDNISKIGNENFLAWSRYNWQTQSWQPAKHVGINVRGHWAPTIDAYAGKLHCVYNDIDDWLWWTTYTQQEDQEDGTWSEPQRLEVRASAHASIAPYHDYLYCCYKDYNRKLWVKRCNDQGGWEEARPIPEHTTRLAASPPAITAFNGLLYLMVCDMDRWIVCNTYSSESNTWSGWEKCWRLDTLESVTMAAYAGKLHVMYSSSSNMDDVKWTAYDPETKAWSPHEALPGMASSFTSRPRLSHYNGLLYAIVNRMVNNSIETWWASLGADLPKWTMPERIPQIQPDSSYVSYGFGLTPYHGQLYAMYFTR